MNNSYIYLKNGNFDENKYIDNKFDIFYANKKYRRKKRRIQRMC